MKKSKFTEEQIAFALRQAEAGTSVEQVCRKLGVSQATFFRWKKQFGGMGTAELRRLRLLEEENRKLEQLVADLSLDKAMLQDVLSKKVRAPPAAASSSRACGPPTGRASAGPAGRSPSRGRASGTSAAATRRTPCGSASATWPGHGSATATAGSTSCSAAEAGGSTTRGSTGSTRRRGWP